MKPSETKIKKVIFYSLFFLFSFLFIFNFCQADDEKTSINEGPLHNLQVGGESAGWEVWQGEGGSGALAEQLIGQIINIVLAVIGIIFLILMIYGGFTWMNAHGDKEKIEVAKKTIRNAAIGLVVVLGAFIIVVTVMTYLS